MVVALRKESVDRNPPVDTSSVSESASLSARRAWIEMFLSMGLDGRFKSLSARRAWIEIFLMYHCICKEVVALRKESVDRNIWVDKTQSAPRMSLSARRAWIEISDVVSVQYRCKVALRKESVDRNCPPGPLSFLSGASLSARRAWIEINLSQTFARRWAGRSPQGERG